MLVLTGTEIREQEVLTDIIDKAFHICNPVQAAFLPWVNLAYLQPFADGNKRTSRLSANLPLMLYNCAPLSLLDVDAPAMPRRCWESTSSATSLRRRSC